MRILAIDQSIASSGYAILDGKILATYGSIPTVHDPKDPGNLARLWTISEAVFELIGQYKPDIMVLEKYFARGFQGAGAIPEVRGALKVVAYRCGLSYAEYPPQSWKKAMIGNGRAEKEEVSKWVKEQYPGAALGKISDVTDAIALGRYAHEQATKTVQTSNPLQTRTTGRGSEGPRKAKRAPETDPKASGTQTPGTAGSWTIYDSTGTTNKRSRGTRPSFKDQEDKDE